MAFVISKAPPSFSDSEKKPNKVNLHDGKHPEAGNNGVVSSQLLLKSAGKMDRDVVLRRIRYYKRLSKMKRTFEALASGAGGGGSEPANATATADDASERWWLQQHDVFLSP